MDTPRLSIHLSILLGRVVQVQTSTHVTCLPLQGLFLTITPVESWTEVHPQRGLRNLAFRFLELGTESGGKLTLSVRRMLLDSLSEVAPTAARIAPLRSQSM